jgi:aspartyl-tRNA(Asn)/glutamyl-tRNA(Gln) amidotransferase subunit B
VSVPDLGVPPERLGQVLEMVSNDQLAASNAPLVLREMLDTGAGPREVAEKRGLLQGGDDGAVDAAIDALIAQNPKPLQDVRAGKQAAMGALVGMVMRSTKGLNPKTVQERLRARLNV